MVLLDTDVISIHQRTNSRETPILKSRFLRNSDTVFVSSVSFEEQTRGWLAYAAKQKSPDQYVNATAKLHELLTYYTQLPMVLFDIRSAYIFSDLRRKFPRTDTMDLRIAAIALANNATLVTRNLRDFVGIPSLRVEDWTK